MNLDLIKNKLADLDKKSGGGSKHIWKPEIGKHVIRIIPYIHNPEWPFTELHFYYKLKKGTVLSPISFERPDPVYELAQELKQTGDKDEWKTGVNLEPKPRTYVPILVRGKENEGVKFWGFGKTIFQEILKLIDDPDYGDITDNKTGRDLTVEVTKTDKTWPEITIRPKPDRTPITKDPGVLNLIKDTPKVNELWPEPTYDQLKDMLNKYLTNESSAAGDSEGTETADEPELSSDDIFGKNITFDDIPEGPKNQKSSVKEPAATDGNDFDSLFNS